MRGKSDEGFDALKDGIPPYMAEPIRKWLERVVRAETSFPQAAPLERLQMVLQMDPPLNWQWHEDGALADLVSRSLSDSEFGLDALDALLHMQEGWGYKSQLSQILYEGGSAWEVTSPETGYAQLTRRSLGPVAEVLDELSIPSERAHYHLVTAWRNLVGRHPDPSAAYREAIRAVEAAARPVISPENSRATLGTMISAMRDKPEKWRYVLKNSSSEQVTAMAESVWSSQLDRHGTDDESTPLHVSEQQADAAFHVSLALVRIFAGGLLQRVS